MAELDFSADGVASADPSNLDIQHLIDQTSLGTKKDGIYEVKDWDFLSASDSDFISKALSNDTVKEEEKATSTIGSIFARLTGSKVLSEQDLKPVLSAMKDHLMKKNVAKDIAEQVCEGVGETLKGKKIGGFRGRFDSFQSTDIFLIKSCRHQAGSSGCVVYYSDPYLDPENIYGSSIIYSQQTGFRGGIDFICWTCALFHHFRWCQWRR